MSLKDLLKDNRLGFGAAPLGNMFRAIPELEAHATVEAAWNDGVRYYDNAPFYGAAFWTDLRAAGLVDPSADLPGGV